MLLFGDVCNTSIVTIVLSALVIPLACWLMFRRHRKYSPPLPPSPAMALPLIGHLHLLTNDMRVALRGFRKKGGDVYSLMMGSQLTVVLSGYDVIKEGFKTNGDKFPNRGYMPLIERASRSMGKNMLTKVCCFSSKIVLKLQWYYVSITINS
mgnify:CR=1 FL=1